MLHYVDAFAFRIITIVINKSESNLAIVLRLILFHYVMDMLQIVSKKIKNIELKHLKINIVKTWYLLSIKK